MYDQQEEETTSMHDTRRYLRDRMDEVWYSGREALVRKFNLIEEDWPKTAEEVVDRIKSDKFTLPTLDKDGFMAYGTGPCGLIWRDPTQVADRKGYEEALKELTETKRDTIDIINTLEEADGLKALQDFKTLVKSLAPLPA